MEEKGIAGRRRSGMLFGLDFVVAMDRTILPAGALARPVRIPAFAEIAVGTTRIDTFTSDVFVNLSFVFHVTWSR